MLLEVLTQKVFFYIRFFNLESPSLLPYCPSYRSFLVLLEIIFRHIRDNGIPAKDTLHVCDQDIWQADVYSVKPMQRHYKTRYGREDSNLLSSGTQCISIQRFQGL